MKAGADLRAHQTACEEPTAHEAPEVWTLPEILRRRAVQQSDRLAYRVVLNGQFKEVQLTYKELDERASAVASHLCSRGLSGSRIALLLPTSIDFLAAFFGIFYCGGTAVPLSPPRASNSVERLGAILDDVDVDGILTNEIIRSKLVGSEIRLSDCQKFILNEEIPPSCEAGHFEPGALQDVAVIQFTSGSTSVARGVEVSHSNFVNNALMMARASNLTTESVGVNWLPLFHDMGLMGGVIQPLFTGFPISLLSPTAFFARPFLWLRAMTIYKATVSGAPDFGYNLCSERIRDEQIADLELSDWKVAYSGAEPVRAKTLDQFAQRFSCCGFDRRSFFPCYGLAEATLIVSGGPARSAPEMIDVSRTSLERDGIATAPVVSGDVVRLVASGRPVDGQTVLIVDPTALTVCREAVVGEIWIKGASVARGYWNKPEATQEVFDAFVLGGTERFLRSGDLGFLLDGNLFVTGRIKDLIIIRGGNHYPQDIEATVEQRQHELRPAGSAAFSIEAADKEHLILVCELKRDWRGDPSAILREIRHSIIEQHGLGADVVVLVAQGALPRTTSGKIQRHLARHAFQAGRFDVVAKWQAADIDMVLAGGRADLTKGQTQSGVMSRADGESTESAVPTEKLLIDIWSEVLKVDQIGVESNFFEFGGDSALLVTAQLLLSEALGRQVPITVLFQYPTIRALGEYLSGTGGNGSLHRSKLRGRVRRGTVSRRGLSRSTESPSGK